MDKHVLPQAVAAARNEYAAALAAALRAAPATVDPAVTDWDAERESLKHRAMTPGVRVTHFVNESAKLVQATVDREVIGGMVEVSPADLDAAIDAALDEARRQITLQGAPISDEVHARKVRAVRVRH